ncbi:MAG: VanZ family protein [Candidatus Parcubacteria bacterium]|nr:VanZ family protein [Candidatus Parcubacteria bacterium]
MILKKIGDKIKKIIAHRHWQKYEKYISLIFWLAAIFILSNNSLKEFVIITDWWEFILRKLVHLFEFAVLTYLIFRILGQTEKRHIFWNLGWSFVFTVLYAISDEYHQSFIAGRTGTYRDVIIDSVGSLIALWLIYLDWHYHKNKKI